MKPIAWIVSGLVLAVVLPIATLMTVFAHDAPTVPTSFAVIRFLLAATLDAIPVVWVTGLVLSISETRKGRREQLLKRYQRAPYWALGAHLLVWGIAFAAMARS